jgi:hypothetical protein
MMAEPTTYNFDLREVTLALLKQQGLHEGLWDLGFEFGLVAGMLGPTPDQVRPSAMIQMSALQLTRHAEGAPFGPYTVDAAAANPKRRKGRGRSEADV